MAKEKGKGSIIFEILILILIAGLIGTIIYPKTIWEEEERNTKLCRHNMELILKAELINMKYKNNYSDTLENVVNFIKADTTHELLNEFVSSDTTLTVEILNHLMQDPYAAQIIENMKSDTLLGAIIETAMFDPYLGPAVIRCLQRSDTTLASIISSLEVPTSEEENSSLAILESLRVALPPLSVITPLEQDDSLSLVVKRMRPDLPAYFFIDSLRVNKDWQAAIDSITLHTLDFMHTCPSVGKEYKITVIDTSVIKYVSIACPIDSLDKERVRQDFWRYYFGNLRLENHGKIDPTGEKSWEQ